MKVTNLSTLKIHKLSQEQYERELAAGNIDENAIYITPDENNNNVGITYALSKSGSEIILTGSDGSTTSVFDADNDSNTTYTLSKSGSTITLTGSDGSTTSVDDSDTTYSAGNGLTLSDRTFNIGAGTGISVAADTVSIAAAGSTLGGVKSGGDVTISNGIITVNDDSHNHVISNVDGLQTALDNKVTRLTDMTKFPCSWGFAIGSNGNQIGVSNGDNYYLCLSSERTLQIGTQLNGATSATWDTVLDSTNYNSYALPLSGGTMTGAITLPADDKDGIICGAVGGLNMDCYGNIRPNDSSANSWNIYKDKNKLAAAFKITWASGNTEIAGNVTAPKFIGALQGNADTATSAGYLTFAGDTVANKRTQSASQALFVGGWESSDAGYGSQFGTTLDISGKSTWYHRLAFHTGGEIDYWMGINTNTLTKQCSLITSANIGSQSVNYATSAGSAGTCTGNAATASKLGTSTKGGATTPIWLYNGTPYACDTYIVKKGGGTYSIVNGTSNSAVDSGSRGWSVAIGDHLTADSENFVIGHYNKAPSSSGGGGSGDAFVIGKGYSGSLNNAFRVTYAGATYGNSAYNSSGADYAEYFEWKDSNPTNEDRRGFFVTLEENKIKIAQPGDYILGIISALPSVIGNSDEDWRGKYIYDEFGDYITEEFEYEEDVPEEVANEETGEVTVKMKTVIKTGVRWKENPDYDPSIPYIQREDRPEWDAVGMVGVLAVRDDGTCQVNGYCKVAAGGTATAASERTLDTYRVIERVNDHVVKVILK